MVKNKSIIKELLLISLISFLPVLLIYLPFILKFRNFFFLNIKDPGIFNIFRNWDGPNYLMVARTWYDLEEIGKRLYIPLDVRYFAAHFPLYPFLIAIASFFMSNLYAGIFVNIVFGFLLNILFYLIAKRYTKHPYFLTLVFTIFPPRYWVLRTVITPETLMVFSILLSVYLWDKKKYLLSSVVGLLGVLTKIQVLFLFPAYVFQVIEKKIRDRKPFDWRIAWMFLIPLGFIGLSLFYYFRMGDLLAFFHAEKNNNLFVYFPFSQFNYANPWAGWHLEDIVFYFMAMFTCIAALWKRKERTWFYFTFTYTVFLIFIPHGDIARYAYPILPFFLLVFESFFTARVFKWVLLFSLPALYFYAVNFMLVNQAPIADWSLLLK